MNIIGQLIICITWISMTFYRYIGEEKNQTIAEMRMLQMLTIAIHTGEPGEFIQELEDVINDDPSRELVGDLDGLENLKYKREQYRMAGDM